MTGQTTITCIQCNQTYVITEQPTTWKSTSGGLICQHCLEKNTLEHTLRFIMINMGTDRPDHFYKGDREVFCRFAKAALESLSPLTPDADSDTMEACDDKEAPSE